MGDLIPVWMGLAVASWSAMAKRGTAYIHREFPILVLCVTKIVAKWHSGVVFMGK